MTSQTSVLFQKGYRVLSLQQVSGGQSGGSGADDGNLFNTVSHG